MAIRFEHARGMSHQNLCAEFLFVVRQFATIRHTER